RGCSVDSSAPHSLTSWSACRVSPQTPQQNNHHVNPTLLHDLHLINSSRSALHTITSTTMSDLTLNTPWEKALQLTPAPSTSTATHSSVSAFLPADWCIGVVPHGGYLSSLLLTAAVSFIATHPTASAIRVQTHPITLHAEFLRRTSIGPCRLSV